MSIGRTLDGVARNGFERPVLLTTLPFSTINALPHALLEARDANALSEAWRVYSQPIESPPEYGGATGRGNRPERPKGKAMYAVIKTGGKQYRVAKDDVLTIERIAGEPGSTVEFSDVLMVGSGDSVKVGAPFVSGAKVACELVGDARGPKLIAFKKRRRKNSRRKKGHRQDLSTIRVTSITGA
jgi:large subunit ribosomal protein L21